MPSHHNPDAEGPDEQHSNVFSPNNRNYQMFAFCPGISPAKCGIPTQEDSLEFDIFARISVKSTISTTELKYREGEVSVRRYDACHYMIHSSTMAPATPSQEESQQGGGRLLDGHEGEEEEEEEDEEEEMGNETNG